MEADLFLFSNATPSLARLVGKVGKKDILCPRASVVKKLDGGIPYVTEAG